LPASMPAIRLGLVIGYPVRSRAGMPDNLIK